MENKKPRINIRREDISKEEVDKNRDFKRLKANYDTITRPLWKKPKFLSLVILLLVIIALVLIAIEEEKNKAGHPSKKELDSQLFSPAKKQV